MSEDCIEMLKQEFVDRRSRRPHYSKRAFARDLGLSSSFLSLLFNKKRILSPKTSFRISKMLNWNEARTSAFLNSAFGKQLHAPQVPTSDKLKVVDELEHDRFRLISNPKHFLVLEFLQTRGKSTVDELIDYFSIEKTECEIILYRLLRLDFISEENSFYFASTKHRKVSSVPSESIKSHHEQSLQMAIQALRDQEFNRREFRSLIFNISPSQLSKAKKDIEAFMTRFQKKYSFEEKGEIYQLNIQLFSQRKKVHD